MPRGGGLTEPKKLSDDLADICGVEEASRGSCMKYLFAYTLFTNSYQNKSSV